VNRLAVVKAEEHPLRHDLRHSVLELLAELFLNDIPAATDSRNGFEILRAFVEDLALLVRNRNRLRSGGNSAPERLQVIDLFVDRQVVEGGRRKRDGS
jgi:hypothetical protein